MKELLNNGYHSFSNKALIERNESFSSIFLLVTHSCFKLDKNEGLTLMKVKNNFNQKIINLLASPAPMMKKNNRYYYQLLVNTNNRKLLLNKTSEIREYIIKQKKSNIKWSIDIDPIDLY